MPRLLTETTYFGDALYALLPEYWREEDHSYRYVAPETGAELELLPFHQRFMRVMSAHHDTILAAVNAFLDWFDALKCPAALLPHLALNFGWPLDPSMNVTTQRLVIRKVFELIYFRKGNLGGIENAVYALTGVPCRVTSDFCGVGGRGILRYHGEWSAVSMLPAGPIDPTGDGARILYDATAMAAPEVNRQLAVSSAAGRETALITSVAFGTIRLDRALTYPHPVGAQVLLIHDAETIEDVGGYGTGMRYGAGMKPVSFRYDGSAESGDCYGGPKGYASGINADPATEDERRRRFTFTVKFFQTPTDLQLRIARRIIDYMKPARTHYRFETAAIIPHDRFIYGESRLDGIARYAA